VLQAIDDKVKKEVDEALLHAKNDPEPSPEELYSHVHSQTLPGTQIRGCDPFTFYTPK
jgi:TPP-dependent pyruvate/acetoin dehydrogenase alpha subunit